MDAAALLAALTAPGSVVAADPPAAGPKVAIIVGPVGELTATYRGLAELAATAAERHGASVARAYSPAATPEAVLAAVAGASYVVYFGHGNGFPSPYAEVPNPLHQNGWGLQGPAARGTDEDHWQDGTLAYLGEDWIRAHARPAPGWVMIYSNACFAPGAGDAVSGPADLAAATARAAAYSRTPLTMGARAYFATDFYAGAATLLDALLAADAPRPEEIYLADPRLASGHVAFLPHPSVANGALLLFQGPYLHGETNFWYAYAGPRSITEPAPPPTNEAVVPDPPLAGLVGQVSLTPATDAVLAAGSAVGHVLRADGSIAAERIVELEAPTDIVIAARARLGAAQLALVASGPLAGTWVPSRLLSRGAAPTGATARVWDAGAIGHAVLVACGSPGPAVRWATRTRRSR